jgi:hypothetical protein
VNGGRSAGTSRLREERVRRLIQAALIAVVVAALAHTRADPDLWGHTLFGGDIVAGRSIPSQDPYSFTSDIPWVNHEWLSEVGMYIAYATLGGTGLIVLKVATVLLALLVVALTLRFEHVRPPVRDLLIAIAAVASVQQANAVRPQVFSILLFAGALAVMVRVERGQVRMLAWLPLLFAVWVNFHGGWIVGAGIVGLWALVRLIQAPRERSARLALGAAVLGVISTLVNPYGWGMWRFLLTTVRVNRAEIADWQPIYYMGPGIYLTWLAVTVLAIAAVWRSRERPERPRAVVVLVLIAGSFRVNRLLTFLALATVTLLAPQFQQAFGRVRRARETPGPAASSAPLAAAAIVSLIVLTAGLGAAINNARCVRIEPELVPEAAVTEALVKQPPGERMLTWFDWGEYAIWYLSPRVKVSLDGRRETVYRPQVTQEHLMLYFTGQNARGFLDKHDIDSVWLPASLPVVSALASQPDVVTLWRGERSVVFARPERGVRPLFRVDGGASPGLDRCFPGP